MQIRKFFTAGILLILSCASLAQIPGYPYQNSRNIEIDSLRIHYRLWEPAGTPKGKVVFIHGFCGSTFNFRNNIDYVMNAGYKVVAIDLPGFGYSERNELLNQSQSNRARLVWLLLSHIDQTDTSSWNLVGHSMGGGVVEAMAIMNPEKTRSVTIIDGLLLSKNGAFYQSFFSLSDSKKRDELLAEFTRKNFITYRNLEKKLKNIYGFAPDSSIIYEYLRPLEIPGTEHTIINMLTNAAESITFNTDSLLKIPILVVWGGNDKTIRLSNGKHFVKELPQAQLKVIPEAWHAPNETHPAIFNPMLTSFLDANNKFGITQSGTP